MKKNFMKTALVAVFCCAVGYTAYNAQNKNENLSDVMLNNVEALAGDEYHQGQSGTNWKTYTISCTVAQQNSSSYSWYWDTKAGAYVYGIPVGAGAGGGSSESSQVTYAPTTYDKDVCGSGAGLCFASAPSGHPCA